MNRRHFLRLAALAPAVLAVPATATATAVDVYKDPQCGCCGDWVAHLRRDGFAVAVHDVPSTVPYRQRAGIPVALGSCHTAFVAGYALEGHVPAADIRRLLAQRPSGVALVVPGMPATAPGMDNPHGGAWDVLLLAADGTTRVFAAYPAR